MSVIARAELLRRRERTLEVGLQVGDVLDADRQPEELRAAAAGTAS
jgi:hypothetical protein